ncbi:MAG: HNH endonuclease [Blautia producta]|uniref:HNH endonuclease n=1 Tax=Blautia producta TaxID=33035 RepID=UPI00290EAE95|nr:HNH endonuclease [Blautia producta]MDU5381390.1 HNH endonuclease [Blautia producta]MDU6882463.1 HNH endonuclease [Blautia producta]
MAKEYAKAFYNSDAWKKTRAAYYKHCGGICERCMREFKEGKRSLEDVKPVKIIHHKKHITPKNINDPRITLSFDNLEGVCDDHHNKEHKAKVKRYRFDKQGNIIKNNNYPE